MINFTKELFDDRNIGESLQILPGFLKMMFISAEFTPIFTLRNESNYPHRAIFTPFLKNQIFHVKYINYKSERKSYNIIHIPFQ